MAPPARQLDVAMHYLALTLAPEGQTIFHVVPDIGFADARTFAALATVSGLLLLAWRVRKTTALVTFGVFWFLLVLVPSTTLTLLSPADPMAEHRIYVASCGLFLAMGTAAAWGGRPARRRSPAAVAARPPDHVRSRLLVACRPLRPTHRRSGRTRSRSGRKPC